MCTNSVRKGGSRADVFCGLAHAHAHATCRLLGPGRLLEPEGVGVEEEVVAGHPEPEGVAVHHPPQGEVVLGHLYGRWWGCRGIYS